LADAGLADSAAVQFDQPLWTCQTATLGEAAGKLSEQFPVPLKAIGKSDRLPGNPCEIGSIASIAAAHGL
jgi:hypothetical protein